MRLIAFDAPNAAGDWSDRMQTARDAIGDAPMLSAVNAVIVKNNEHAKTLFHAVKARNGEGLMVRRPDLAYRAGRTREMIKIKYV
jgi:DNA ligase-1